MISASPATIFSLCADVTLAAFAAALIFLALWRNVRRRSSQLFALTMFWLGLYGLVNVPLHLAEPLELDPYQLFSIASVIYVLGLLSTANFLLSFAGAPYSNWWGMRLLGVPIAAGMIALTLSHKVFAEIALLGHGDYTYVIAPAGLVGIGIGVGYLGGIAWALWRSNIERARESAIPVFVLFLGLASLTVAARFDFHRYSPDMMTLIVGVIMLGHVLLRHQVFLPLEQLNAQLERQNVELQAATRAKAQFLANMSHDLRTPLNSILGYTRVFLSGAYGEPTEAQAERLQRILRNGQHLLEMINDVLDFSRIDAQQLELYRKRVVVGALLDGVADEFEARARAKGLCLVRGYGELSAIYADEERIRQALHNLVDNALRYTTRGAIILRGYYDVLQERVVLGVTDTGAGIAPEAQKRLFEPLVPVLAEPSERLEGMGLGLFITKKLVELHGGRIWYESTLGQGCTFYMALPAHEIPSRKGAMIVPPHREGGRLTLIVTSQAEAAKALQRAFEAEHLDAYGVVCAHVGLQVAHEMHPALIVLDENVARVPVGRVLLALHHDPATTQTPVLLLTQQTQPLFPLLPNVRTWVPHDAPPAAVLQKARALLNETVSVEAAL